MQSTIHPDSDSQGSENNSGAVFRIVYRSRSNIPDTDLDQALNEILQVARVNNAAKGITGALMLYDHWFAQLLEGDEVEIQKLFAVIRSDLRHRSIEITEQTNAPGRIFTRWAMANVGEHGSPDIPLVATTHGTTEGAPWRLNSEQESVVDRLRNLTRGYGVGS
jgi:Sensors of blue-light using FAD